MVAAIKTGVNTGGAGGTGGLWAADHVLLLTLNVGYVTVSVSGNVPRCMFMVCALLCVFIMLQ